MTKRIGQDYEDEIAVLLRDGGPATSFRISQRKNIPLGIVRKVLARLKGAGLITWRGDGEPARWKTSSAHKDPSPFPRPSVVPQKRSLGWWG